MGHYSSTALGLLFGGICIVITLWLFFFYPFYTISSSIIELLKVVVIGSIGGISIFFSLIGLLMLITK